jgi:hypothetical protein
LPGFGVVGDILYVAGFVEGFGEFCEGHGIEVLINDTLGLLTHQTMTTENEPLSPLRTVVEGEKGAENTNDVAAVEIRVPKSH